tara:strand:+ start:990 stop:1124 length:135 start_codon:yes stop_codon:yes gene_type:complete
MKNDRTAQPGISSNDADKFRWPNQPAILNEVEKNQLPLGEDWVA